MNTTHDLIPPSEFIALLAARGIPAHMDAEQNHVVGAGFRVSRVEYGPSQQYFVQTPCGAGTFFADQPERAVAFISERVYGVEPTPAPVLGAQRWLRVAVMLAIVAVLL